MCFVKQNEKKGNYSSGVGRHHWLCSYWWQLVQQISSGYGNWFAGCWESTKPSILTPWNWLFSVECCYTLPTKWTICVCNIHREQNLAVIIWRDLTTEFWKKNYLKRYLRWCFKGNIAKGTTDPRVEFWLPKWLPSVISQDLKQILIRFHLQNLDEATTSKPQPKISILTRLKLQNLDQTVC